MDTISDAWSGSGWAVTYWPLCRHGVSFPDAIHQFVILAVRCGCTEAQVGGLLADVLSPETLALGQRLAAREYQLVRDGAEISVAAIPTFLMAAHISMQVVSSASPDALKTDRQALLVVELGFVLRMIATCWHRRFAQLGFEEQVRGELTVTLSYNYFLAASRDFQTRTGRRLNRAKLLEMLKLLERLGFIRRVNWANRPAGTGRMDAGEFGPGPNWPPIPKELTDKRAASVITPKKRHGKGANGGAHAAKEATIPASGPDPLRAEAEAAEARRRAEYASRSKPLLSSIP